MMFVCAHYNLSLEQNILRKDKKDKQKNLPLIYMRIRTNYLPFNYNTFTYNAILTK